MYSFTVSGFRILIIKTDSLEVCASVLSLWILACQSGATALTETRRS